MAPNRRIEKHTLVCGLGMDAFVHAGREWPCGSRWVRPRDAALLMAVEPAALEAQGEGVPRDWRGWVSLDWVEGILAARGRAR